MFFYLIWIVDAWLAFGLLPQERVWFKSIYKRQNSRVFIFFLQNECPYEGTGLNNIEKQLKFCLSSVPINTDRPNLLVILPHITGSETAMEWTPLVDIQLPFWKITQSTHEHRNGKSTYKISAMILEREFVLIQRKLCVHFARWYASSSEYDCLRWFNKLGFSALVAADVKNIVSIMKLTTTCWGNCKKNQICEFRSPACCLHSPGC